MTKAGLEALIAELKMRSAEPEKAVSPCFSGKGDSCWMNHPHGSSMLIGFEQEVSLKALIAHAARKTGRNEYGLERDFSNHFCIPNVKCLPSHLYDDAVRHICANLSAHGDLA